MNEFIILTPKEIKFFKQHIQRLRDQILQGHVEANDVAEDDIKDAIVEKLYGILFEGKQDE